MLHIISVNGQQINNLIGRHSVPSSKSLQVKDNPGTPCSGVEIGAGHTIISSWPEFVITFAWNARVTLAGESRKAQVRVEQWSACHCLFICVQVVGRKDMAKESGELQLWKERRYALSEACCGGLCVAGVRER